MWCISGAFPGHIGVKHHGVFYDAPMRTVYLAYCNIKKAPIFDFGFDKIKNAF
jgi:hypothetical protein